MAATQAQVEAAGSALASIVTLVYHNWAAVADNPTVRRIACEAAGLLDVVTGIQVTNPDERARLHVRTMETLVDELSAVGVGTYGNKTKGDTNNPDL